MSPSPFSNGSHSSTVLTPAPARPGLVWLSFAAVYVLWGSTYYFIRIGIETIPPFILAGLRHIMFGFALFPVVRGVTGEKPTATHWRTAILTGLLLLLCGNGMVSWAETRVPSGIAALLVATVSLWMVILDWLRPGGNRPVPRVLVGIVLGFAGIALLVGPAQFGSTDRLDLAGALALLFAALAWAAGSIYSRHRPTPRSPLLGATMQSISAAAALWLVALLTGEIHNFHFAQVSTRSWLAVIYLVIFGSALGFSAYVYILRHSTASRVATYAFVNPVVALFLGSFFGQETVSLRTLVASATILAAVLLVITAPHQPSTPVDEKGPVPGEA